MTVEEEWADWFFSWENEGGYAELETLRPKPTADDLRNDFEDFDDEEYPSDYINDLVIEHPELTYDEEEE
jgi:hypothetical protein